MLRLFLLFALSLSSLFSMDRDFTTPSLAIITSDGKRIEDPLLEYFDTIKMIHSRDSTECVDLSESPVDSASMCKLLALMNGEITVLKKEHIEPIVRAADYLCLNQEIFSALADRCKREVYEHDPDLDPLVKDILYHNSFYYRLKRGNVVPSRDFLPTFAVLDLSNKGINKIEALHALTDYVDPKGVTSIYLDHNRIKTLDKKTMDDILGTFYNLTALDLSHNQIEEIQSKALQGLPTGFKLLLNDNKIEKIASDALSAQELGFINFTNNPAIGPKEYKKLERQVTPSKFQALWRGARNLGIKYFMLCPLDIPYTPPALLKEGISGVANEQIYDLTSKVLNYYNPTPAFDYIAKDEKIRRKVLFAARMLPFLSSFGHGAVLIYRPNYSNTSNAIFELIHAHSFALDMGISFPEHALKIVPKVLSLSYAGFIAGQLSLRFFSKIKTDLIRSHPHYFDVDQNVKLIVDPVQFFGDEPCARCELVQVRDVSRLDAQGTLCCRKFICKECANDLWQGAPKVCPACKAQNCQKVVLHEY